MSDKNAPPPPYNSVPPPGGAPPPTSFAAGIAGMTPMPPLGPDTCHVVCPSCHGHVSTRVQKEPTTKTHIIALLLFPCICVPYCIDSCQATNHYCPICNAYLGAYDK